MKPKDPIENVSEGRQATHTLGLAMQGLGCLLFGLPFIAIPLTMINKGATFDRVPYAFIGSIIGFGLLAAGGIVQRIGRQGVAGAGLILDPNRAVAETRPWNRMQGRMLNDTLGEVDALQGAAHPQVVKVRCPQCRNLNDETDRFCGTCGVAI